MALIDVLVAVATGGQSELVKASVKMASGTVEAYIDVQNQVVRLGEKVFRALPGELLFPGSGPLAGLLKNELEDELILLNPLGVVSVTPVIDGVMALGSLLGLIKHRAMREDELEVARSVFGATVDLGEQVRITNLGGLSGRPFVVPLSNGGSAINLAGDYSDGRIQNMPVLLHEVMHVWQLERDLLPELFLCKGLAEQAGGGDYDYVVGQQYQQYSREEQAEIVEDLVITYSGSADPCRLFAPQFRYINGNVRRGSITLNTSAVDSLRVRMAESGRSVSGARMLVNAPPSVWW